MDSLNDLATAGRPTGWALALLLSVPLVGANCFGQERPSSGAVEEFEAEFDVGIVYQYQPQPGEYGITELMIAVVPPEYSSALILLALFWLSR